MITPYFSMYGPGLQESVVVLSALTRTEVFTKYVILIEPDRDKNFRKCGKTSCTVTIIIIVSTLINSLV